MAAHHMVDAMRRAAKRHLPRFVFDYGDGGAGDETALGEARTAFARRRMVPPILSGSERRYPFAGRLFALSDCAHCRPDWASGEAGPQPSPH